MNENEKNLLMAIEKLNTEYMNLKKSKEYSLGNNIIEIFSKIKKFQFIQLYRLLKNKIINKREKKRYVQKKYEVKGTEDYSNIDKKKIVIYTCITGDYDYVMEPLYKNKNIDYILLTNNNQLKSVNWKIQIISDELQQLYTSNVLLNRYVKMNPHKIFKGYDYSIYIDGNIRLVSDLSSYINRLNKEVGLALHMHAKRNSIYEEEKACERLRKGNIQKMREQLCKYKNEGFPCNYGLLEANLIVTDLKNENAKKILNLWWDDFITEESYRDQLSLPYILWKNNIKIDDVGVLGNNVRNNPKIQVISHK